MKTVTMSEFAKHTDRWLKQVPIIIKMTEKKKFVLLDAIEFFGPGPTVFKAVRTKPRSRGTKKVKPKKLHHNERL